MSASLDIENTIKLLGMLGSDNNEEILVSAKTLNQYLKSNGCSYYTFIDDITSIQKDKISSLMLEVEELESTCKKLGDALDNQRAKNEEILGKLSTRELEYGSLVKSHQKIIDFMGNLEKELTNAKDELDGKLVEKIKQHGKKIINNEEFVRLAQCIVGSDEGKRGRGGSAGWKLLISEKLGESKSAVYMWSNNAQSVPQHVLEKLRTMVKERFA